MSLQDDIKTALDHPTIRVNENLRREVWGTAALIDRRALPMRRWVLLPLSDDILFLPCPFCGSNELVAFRTFDKERSALAIQCGRCGCIGPTGAHCDDSPVKAWNTRSLI